MSESRKKSGLSLSFFDLQATRIETNLRIFSVDSLRRRFEQNQTDCTFTVLALLPTASENILAALPVEELTNQLQQKKAERLAKLSAGEATTSELSSGPPSTIDDGGKGLDNFKSRDYIQANQQLAESGLSDTSTTTKSRTQLWNELKINCELCSILFFSRELFDGIFCLLGLQH